MSQGGHGRGDQAARRDTGAPTIHARLVRSTHSCPGTSSFAPEAGSSPLSPGSPAPRGLEETAGRIIERAADGENERQSL